MKYQELHSFHGQMSESFLTAAFLSMSGGLQDAYTYLFRGEVFANAQTGNIVLLSNNLIVGNWPMVVRYFVPLAFFALGVAAAELIRERFQKVQKIHWRQLVLIVEIALLLVVGFLPNKVDLLANAMVSFACAMQVQAFRKVDGSFFASTMCIGNLRSGVEAVCIYHQKHRPLDRNHAAHYFGIILMFALGAGLGGRMIPILGAGVIWISCVLLLVGLCLMFIQADEETLKNAQSHCEKCQQHVHNADNQKSTKKSL